MIEWLAAHSRVRTVALVAVGLVTGLVLLAFTLVGIDRASSGSADESNTGAPPVAAESPMGDEPSPSRPASPAQPPPATEPPEDEGPAAALPDLPDTDDPDTYASAVAEVLFGMDHALYGPADYEAFFDAGLWDEIVDDDRARILATIRRRIPTEDMWAQMRSIEQTSEFEVELVWEPRTGRDHREAGDWPDGVVLRNVSGVQTETWHPPDEDAQSSSRQVAVTVGLACPPAASPCRLVSIQPNVES